jgi:hypothetical protein
MAIDDPPVYTIFPDGKSTPPPSPDSTVVVPPNVESVRVDGLNEATDETLLEKSITVPFGARIGEWRLAAIIFVKTGGLVVVLYIHMLLVPPMTTFPLGIRTPPVLPKTPVKVKLEYTKEVGSSCPIFAFVFGIKTTFPFGARTPPPNPEVAETLEYAYVKGLNIPAFEEVAGIKITFPDGKRTPPLNLPAVVSRPAVTTAANCLVAGLKNPTVDAL